MLTAILILQIIQLFALVIFMYWFRQRLRSLEKLVEQIKEIINFPAYINGSKF